MADTFRKYRPALLVGLINLAVLVAIVYAVRRPEPRTITITTPVPRPTATITLIQVQVGGAIKNPGIYKLSLGARVADLLALAGGAQSEADLSKLNLARKLKDGEAVDVPARAAVQTLLPTAAGPPSRETALVPSATPQGRININTATLEELDRLPHIGPVLAQRIIDYRMQNGRFEQIEDLKLVKGIGESVFDSIKDLVTTD